MIEKLGEISVKLWSLGKIAIGGLAVFEFIKWAFDGLIEMVKAWFMGKIDQVWLKILEQAEVLRIDLAPSPAFMGFIAKANVIIPLFEIWKYFLLYLGVASVVLGIKWMRNLIPGIK